MNKVQTKDKHTRARRIKKSSSRRFSLSFSFLSFFESSDRAATARLTVYSMISCMHSLTRTLRLMTSENFSFQMSMA